MSDALEVIDRLPKEIGARLEADEYFIDLPVVVYEELNVESELQFKQAVLTEKNGKIGAAVVVLQVVADDLHRGIQFGPMTLYPAVQVIEATELNRGPNGTGKSARQIARRVRDVIKCFGATGLVIDMKPDKPCIEPVEMAEKLGRNLKSYGVYFQCLEQTDQVPSQVGKPECDLSTGQIVLASPTMGAVIYYTVDGSYPSAANSQARLFSGAVDQSLLSAAPTTIRFCAYKAGLIASWVSAATITPNT